MISEIGALVSTKGGVLSTKRCTCQQQSSAAACTGQQQSSAAACTGQQHRDTNTAAATTKRQHVQPHVHTETQIQQQLRRRDNTCRRRYNTIPYQKKTSTPVDGSKSEVYKKRKKTDRRRRQKDRGNEI